MFKNCPDFILSSIIYYTVILPAKPVCSAIARGIAI